MPRFRAVSAAQARFNRQEGPARRAFKVCSDSARLSAGVNRFFLPHCSRRWSAQLKPAGHYRHRQPCAFAVHFRRDGFDRREGHLAFRDRMVRICQVENHSCVFRLQAFVAEVFEFVTCDEHSWSFPFDMGPRCRIGVSGPSASTHVSSDAALRGKDAFDERINDLEV